MQGNTDGSLPQLRLWDRINFIGLSGLRTIRSGPALFFAKDIPCTLHKIFIPRVPFPQDVVEVICGRSLTDNLTPLRFDWLGLLFEKFLAKSVFAADYLTLQSANDCLLPCHNGCGLRCGPECGRNSCNLRSPALVCGSGSRGVDSSKT